MFPFFSYLCWCVLLESPWAARGEKLKWKAQILAFSTFSKFIKLLIWIFPWLRGHCSQPLNLSGTTWSVGAGNGCQGHLGPLGQDCATSWGSAPTQVGDIMVEFFLASLILVFPPSFSPMCAFSICLKFFRRIFNSGLQRQLRNKADAGSTPRVVNDGYKMEGNKQ